MYYPFGATSTPQSGLPVFNVKNFGATGNGSTDDTTALKAAYASLVAAGGGTLYFPIGTYCISSALQWGNGGPALVSVPQIISVIGQGSGGSVTLLDPPSASVIKWIGPVNAGPMLNIFGPVTVNMAGICWDGAGVAQDGIYEIYNHGAIWMDVFTQNFQRCHWFRTRWTTNPPFPPQPTFVEGSSSNVYINCGGGEFSQTTTQKWMLIQGGNPYDLTDRTSNNTSDPYNSTFIKCRWRADGSTNMNVIELRYTDSNSYFHCDGAGNPNDPNSFGIVVAQNPNKTGFPSAQFYFCAIGPYGTVGPFVPGAAIVSFFNNNDFEYNPYWNGKFFPWLLMNDVEGSYYKQGGYRPRNIGLRAVVISALALTPADTNYHAFPTTTGSFADSFNVFYGDLTPANTSGGNKLRFKASGTTNTTGTPGNIQIQILVGATVIADTGSIGLTASQTNEQWSIDCDLYVKSYTATTCVVSAFASKMMFQGATSNAGLQQCMPLQGTNGVISSIPSNASLPITIQAKFSIVGQSITLQGASYSVELPEITGIA
jgi:hypothetical protein